VAAPPEHLLRFSFRSLATLHLALGVWLIAWPHAFFTTIGAFGPYNPHYERDAGTFYLAFALGAWWAATRPRWRVPVLALFTVQYAAHTVNHLFDAGRSHNGWSGPLDAASLGLTAISLGALLWGLSRTEVPA
jgi:hypothetical protein